MRTADTPWSDVRPLPAAEESELPQRSEVDACVVGAGIAGLTTAYLLARSGRAVVVLDAGEIGGGETSHTSAHLVTALDDRFSVLERLHGHAGARLAAESHAAAIDFIERLVETKGIDCGFTRVDGYLVSAQRDGTALDEELAAAARAGLSVAYVAAVPGADAWSGPALRFPRQARFDPVAYLRGLVACCLDAGVRLVPRTRVARIHDGPVVEVETADGRLVRAGAAVVATNVPVNDRVLLQTKLEAYRSYVIAARVPTGSVADVLIWDDADPYHYVRRSADAQGDLLIVGGEDHKTGQGPKDADQPHRELERWMRERYPLAGAVVHAWSGQIIEPVDSLAYIGRNPGGRNVYVATGDSGNGLTHGTLAGMLISDQVRGFRNAWEELYRPSRISIRSAGDYAGTTANVLRQYGDWLTAGDVASPEEVPIGGGAIVRNGAHPIAAHRDAAGRLHTCSAICPHLGGLVRWNASEKTWDCPCHGSRFSGQGTVINGPANADLAPAREVNGSFPAQAVVA